jgi:hypothetical protein
LRDALKKVFVALLLSACVGVHVLEVSGRWDRTFSDADDEAGIVAVVLCIGVALSAAGTLLKAVGLSRIAFRHFSVVLLSRSMRLHEQRISIATCTAGPPLPLRI